ncbi:MAG: DUF1778 domain-containing protein [Candidatus Nitrotoga sp.]
MSNAHTEQRDLIDHAATLLGKNHSDFMLYEQFGIVVHGYCLMIKHYHLLIQTFHATLSYAK